MIFILKISKYKYVNTKGMRSIFTFILLTVMTFSTAMAQERFLVANQKLEVRSGPKATFNTIAEVPQGTQVYVLSSEYGEWSAVQYKNINGFVKTKLLVEDNRKQEADEAAANAAQIKANAAAKQKAAQLAAQKAIAAAEKAAREAIAAAERLKRQAEAEAAEAIAKAEIERKNKALVANRGSKDEAATLAAVREAERRAAANGEATAIESTTPSYGAVSKPKPAARNTSAPIAATTSKKYNNWEKKTYKSGATPKSFNFKGKFDYKLDNYLKIEVGDNTDVVVKLYKMGKTEKEDRCIRVTYINSTSTQFIRNIPEGEYYLKIAYGKDWRENVKDGKRYGTFTKNALYEKGQDILDFRAVKTDRGINVPSYNLSLDLLSNGGQGYGNEDQDNISPEQFNDI